MPASPGRSEERQADRQTRCVIIAHILYIIISINRRLVASIVRSGAPATARSSLCLGLAATTAAAAAAVATAARFCSTNRTSSTPATPRASPSCVSVSLPDPEGLERGGTYWDESMHALLPSSPCSDGWIRGCVRCVRPRGDNSTSPTSG
jgi:hypothetical protein